MFASFMVAWILGRAAVRAAKGLAWGVIVDRDELVKSIVSNGMFELLKWIVGALWRHYTGR